MKKLCWNCEGNGKLRFQGSIQFNGIKKCGVCEGSGYIEELDLQAACKKHSWDYKAAEDDLILYLESSDYEDAAAAFPEWYEETLNQNGEEAFDPEYLASCAECGITTHENNINMIDHDLDLCGDCEKKIN